MRRDPELEPVALPYREDEGRLALWHDKVLVDWNVPSTAASASADTLSQCSRVGA